MTRQAQQAAAAEDEAPTEAEFDSIYDNLVKVRTRIAKKLGYPSCTKF